MNPVAKILALAIMISLAASPALAAGGHEPEKHDWSFNGVLGSFDKPALRRGYQVYMEVCSFCHGVEFIAFRNLTEIGLTEDEAKAAAEAVQIEDGPDDNGLMFMRPGRLSDRMPSPFPNEAAARASNGGALPPDLSLITKARPFGPDYLFALLTGFEDPPEGVEISPGMSYNPFFSGQQIAMFSPLYDDAVFYEDGTVATLEQMAEDITQFLMWTAEPKLEDRKRMGLGVMIFLVILTGMFIAVKRRVWADIH
jgi:ubiquinol-cytochrome c reductase cytochrome c1 subunit